MSVVLPGSVPIASVVSIAPHSDIHKLPRNLGAIYITGRSHVHVLLRGQVMAWQYRMQMTPYPLPHSGILAQ